MDRPDKSYLRSPYENKHSRFTGQRVRSQVIKAHCTSHPFSVPNADHHPTHQCGLHATHELELPKINDRGGYVAGAVTAQGRVVVHEEKFRAQQLTIVALASLEGAFYQSQLALQSVAERLGVPVVDFAELPGVAREAGVAVSKSAAMQASDGNLPGTEDPAFEAASLGLALDSATPSETAASPGHLIHIGSPSQPGVTQVVIHVGHATSQQPSTFDQVAVTDQPDQATLRFLSGMERLQGLAATAGCEAFTEDWLTTNVPAPPEVQSWLSVVAGWHEKTIGIATMAQTTGAEVVAVESTAMRALPGLADDAAWSEIYDNCDVLKFRVDMDRELGPNSVAGELS